MQGFRVQAQAKGIVSIGCEEEHPKNPWETNLSEDKDNLIGMDRSFGLGFKVQCLGMNRSSQLTALLFSLKPQRMNE